MSFRNLIVIILILLSLVTLITASVSHTSSVANTKIPKILWTFWNSDSIPPVIKYCVATWHKHNPDHEIRVVTPSNYNMYISDLDISKFKHADSPARISDLVRLHLLSKYGGIWIDASIICNKPLQWVHDLSRGKEFLGYYLESFTTHTEFPVLESWFFACVPNSMFVKKWRDAFMLMNNYSTVNDYVSALRSAGTDLQKIDGPSYLAIHVAAQYVMQVMKYPTRSLVFLKAEDGPYLYLVRNNWDSEKAVSEIVSGKVTTDLIKVRGNERKILERSNLITRYS